MVFIRNIIILLLVPQMIPDIFRMSELQSSLSLSLSMFTHSKFIFFILYVFEVNCPDLQNLEIRNFTCQTNICTKRYVVLQKPNVEGLFSQVGLRD